MAGEPRGMSLERAFAERMKSELGYTRTTLRVPVKGKIADRSYDVDVHGERYSQIWDRLRVVGIVCLVLAALVILLPREMRDVHKWMQSVVASFAPELAGYALVIFGVGGLVLGYMGKQKATTHAWVECKDQRGNVKRAQIQKLHEAVQDVRDSDEAKWKPVVVVVVSGTDFDTDALNFTREYEFVCYRRSGNGFERVK